MVRRYFFSVLIFFSLTGYYIDRDEVFSDIMNSGIIVDPPFLSYSQTWVDSVFNSLSFEEKIAQLLMVAAYSNRDKKHVDEISKLVTDYNIGGLIFFQGGPVRQAIMTNHFQSLAKTPMLVAMDAEWGLSMRLDSTIRYPRQMMLGAIQDDRLIYDMGAAIAEQLTRIGAHINFAPVADINNNPANPVINSRAFGENKINVFIKSLAYMHGLQDNSIIAVGKHFPGHGDTDADSHYELPIINHSLLRMDSLELFPFRYLINSGLSGIMTAHLQVPVYDTTQNLAVSLSRKVVTELLQEELNFKGLIFTDALNMKGVSDYFEPGDLEVRAVLAGNDVLVMPQDVPKAIEMIKKAVEDSIISRELIEEKCYKILAAKKWAGLDNYAPVEIEGISDYLNNSGFELLNRTLVEKSLTLITNKNELLPFRELDTLSIASVTIGESRNNTYQEALKLYSEVACYTINRNMRQNNFDVLLETLSKHNLVIASFHNPDMRAQRNFGVSLQSVAFIEELAKRTNVVLNLFANPYSLNYFGDLSSFKAILLSFEDTDLVRNISAQVLFGGASATGKLPVSVNHHFAVGHGIDLDDKLRLRYSIPEEVGIPSKKLDKIDSIAADAIKKEATPGCQVLVAKDGVVIYHKSFGHHTYQNRIPVSNSDLYDIASITKIAATVPTLMKLFDEEKFELKDKLSKHLAFLDTTDKGKLTISDILTHQARLQPWIPFYTSTLESYQPGVNLFHNRLSDEYPYKIANNYYAHRNITLNDSLYRSSFSFEYAIEVANNIYLKATYYDSIFQKVYESPLLRRKEYRYSDLGYFFLYDLIEHVSDDYFYHFLYHNFYRPLGARTLGFLPLNRFQLSEIVPTENEKIFRKQLLHGHVHDPAAAMMGGISGHAGLFSNANDLAKLMQMFLQEGEYAGKRYISQETVNLFTACQNCNKGNRRGLGFDRPLENSNRNGPTSKLASSSSYGHSGFTGTMAWVDPEYQLVYIFLSNRVHPDQYNNKLAEMNVRTKIQDVIYEAVLNIN